MSESAANGNQIPEQQNLDANSTDSTPANNDDNNDLNNNNNEEVINRNFEPQPPPQSAPNQTPQPPPIPPPPQQQTIVHVRDRLFHALFYRIAIMYARKFPKTVRRMIEFFVLLLAFGSFGLLSYLHVVFNRNPINCLSSIQDKWPRDGILRVEIVHNASTFYIMSYDEEANEQLANDENENKINYSLKQSYEKEYSNTMLDFFSSYLTQEDHKKHLLSTTNQNAEIFTNISTNNNDTNNYANDSSSIKTNETNINITTDQTTDPSTSWFFNPLSFFRIKNNGYKKDKKQANDESNKVNQGENNDKLDDSSSNLLIESTNQEKPIAEAKLEEITRDTADLNESLSMPQVNLDLTKKEIPKSTVETISPTYKLIKDAFSELQLFSRVCMYFFL